MNTGGGPEMLSSLRREPDLSTNANSINETTLQMMLKSHRETEQKWIKEKRMFKDRIDRLTKEVETIRTFVYSKHPIDSNIINLDRRQSPVPSFIKASNIEINDSNENKKMTLTASQNLTRFIELTRKPQVIKSKLIT
jgi:hypothetical protein